MRKAGEIKLKKADREELTEWTRTHTIEKRLADRAKIILMAADGMENKEIAERLETREARICKWRNRFIESGIPGLNDGIRSGKPKEYDDKMERLILKSLDKTPPEGYSIWSGKLLSEYLGDVSEDYIYRVLRKHGIQLQRKHSWCVSTDPQFASKAADIVGLYLDPPQSAIVISVDEKPAIQALERSQGWLRLPNGKAITGYNHEYTRHGTTTLFAALEITTGLIKTKQFNRRRRREFLLFMNEVISEYGSKKEIHVILDNLSTHKPKNDKWLTRHKNVIFHYTPTHASWLNQVEIWFSILERQALKNTSFYSVGQLREGIEKFCEVYNEKASPFEWTKKKVYQKELKNKYSNLYN